MPEALSINIPINFKTWGGRKIIISPKGHDLRVLDNSLRRDDTMLKALSRAHKWQKILRSGKSARAIAHKEKLERSFILRTSRLTLLSPKIINAILNGEQPENFSLEKLRRQSIPPNWNKQAELLGFDNCHY